MRRLKAIQLISLFFLLSQISNCYALVPQMRGLWVWNTLDVIQNANLKAQSPLVKQFVSVITSSGITDLFLSLGPKDYVLHQSELRAFNSKMKLLGIKTWGLNGSRAFFSDQMGPAVLYASVDALIKFNHDAKESESFVGFQTDMEPHDQGSYKHTFHNEVPDSALSTTEGGVWFKSEAEDREMLMRNWLDIHKTISIKLKSVNLLFSGAMVSYTSDYDGEEIQVTYNGIRQCVMKFMMDYLTDYIVMTYNTDPENAVFRMNAQLTYADSLPIERRPRVYGSLETNQGQGGNVSYGDDPTKNTRAMVFADIAIISSLVAGHPSFSGMSLEDWNGWNNLLPGVIVPDAGLKATESQDPIVDSASYVPSIEVAP